jgi:ABC-type glycerol-3-phosphate transport system permease component
MSYSNIAVLLVAGLFAGIMALVALGHRIGIRNLSGETAATRGRRTAVEAAVFGLMGLMIAFTFSGASARYELRRQLIVDEANAIGTAYLLLDLLPSQAEPALRDHFRRYLEAWVAVFQVLPDVEASRAKAAVAPALQHDIWGAAVAALKESPPQATIVVIPALNQMFDVTTSRDIAMRTHTPVLVFAVLVVLALMCSLLAGYAMAGSGVRNVSLHLIAFTVMMAGTVYVIFDLDYPRFGFIRLDFADKALLDLLAGMK